MAQALALKGGASGSALILGAGLPGKTIAPAVATIEFGADTLASAGAVDMPAGETTISDAGGTNLVTNGSTLYPDTGGGVTSGTVTFGNGETRNITAVADAYSVVDDTELDAAISNMGTAGGKTIFLRDGNYGTVAPNTSFTSQVVLKSHTREENPTSAYTDYGGGALIETLELDNCDKIRCEYIEFYLAQETPTTDNWLDALIVSQTDVEGIEFYRCEIHSSTIEKNARGYNWRTGINLNATSSNTIVEECYIHDLGLGVKVGSPTNATPTTNKITKCVVHAIYQIGIGQIGGSNWEFSWNHVYDLFSLSGAFSGDISSATSNTAVLDKSSSNTAEEAEDEDDIFVYMVAEVPGNSLKEITDYDGSTGTITISGTWDSTPSAGTSITIRDESDAHQSYIAVGDSGATNDENIVWKGNVVGPLSFRTSIVNIAGLKANRGPSGEFKNIQIIGNLIMANQGISVEMSRCTGESYCCYNTVVSDRGWKNGGNPGAVFVSDRNGDNVSVATFENNVGGGFAQETATGVAEDFTPGDKYHATKNHRFGDIDTPGQTYADLFDGEEADFNGVNPSDMLTIWNAASGEILTDTATYGTYGAGATAGAVTWPDNFLTRPTEGTINFSLPDRIPDAYSIGGKNASSSETDVTSDAVQITGIDAGTGIRFSDDSHASAEMRILDTDGSTPVTGWVTPSWSGGLSDTTIDNNQYVEVRLDAPSSGTRDATVYVGTGDTLAATYTVTVV